MSASSPPPTATSEAVSHGDFREDLYYRLNVLHLHLPPLRDRAMDIPLSGQPFSRQIRQETKPSRPEISTPALRHLTRLPWEGNIRELENCIERAAILCNNDLIDLADVQLDSELPGPPLTHGSATRSRPPAARASLPEYLDAIEKSIIEQALEAAHNIQAHAAEGLGITKSLLQYKMKKYNINRPG